ncbi:MAG TPA: type II toxin-antitoxin system RelB/DinJ family antitoxin [Myxococcota bacterium]|nr:type II toxin-antitoxin system RelB/DinJ family antitoxin [Myxococcota bacterium]
MLKSAVVRARVEPQVKGAVEKIFDKLGISTSEAINIFFKQVYLNRGLPFAIKIPNEELKEAIESSRKGKNITKYSSAEEMFEKLDM